MNQPTYEKSIVFDRHEHDFAMYLSVDGGTPELVGFAKSYEQAERTLDELVYELLSRASVGEAA